MRRNIVCETAVTCAIAESIAHVRLKENANYGNAGQRLRLNVLHVINR
jgi:hypothetical protein